MINDTVCQKKEAPNQNSKPDVPKKILLLFIKNFLPFKNLIN